MAAIDDLTELVERAAVVEKTALSSKWKEESDVQGLIRRTRKAAEEQRQAVSLDTDPTSAVPALGESAAELPRPRSATRAARPGAVGAGEPRRRADGLGDGDGVARRLSHQAAAQAELDAVAAVGVARMALTDAALAVLQARLARIQAGEDQPECGDGRRSRAAARAQPRQPTRPGPRPRRHRGDQVRAHPQAADHGEVSGDRCWASACSTWATCGCSSGTRTSSGCPTWGCG